MEIGEIIALISLTITILGTIVSCIFLFGRLFEKINNTIIRMNEDRDKNEKQHEEFYSVKDNTITMASEIKSLSRLIEDIKMDIKEILSRLPLHRREGEV